ncbi:protein kinase, partial [Elysia marginata]
MAGSAMVEKPTTVYDLENEDIFERFNLKKVQFLNKGMSGEVFLVTSRTKPGKKLAVKTFDLSSDDVRDRSLRQFSTEAGVMQAVSHQHLVPCVMAARCHDYAALAMPYYPGGDLTRYGKLEPRRANRYMWQVARALEHLHRHHISHNDVKLENVFLDASDRACLGDFGLSMEVKDESRTAIAGLVGGTRSYWSPEKLQADTNARIDPFK